MIWQRTALRKAIDDAVVIASISHEDVFTGDDTCRQLQAFRHCGDVAGLSMVDRQRRLSALCNGECGCQLYIFLGLIDFADTDFHWAHGYLRGRHKSPQDGAQERGDRRCPARSRYQGIAATLTSS